MGFSKGDIAAKQDQSKLRAYDRLVQNLESLNKKQGILSDVAEFFIDCHVFTEEGDGPSGAEYFSQNHRDVFDALKTRLDCEEVDGSEPIFFITLGWTITNRHT